MSEHKQAAKVQVGQENSLKPSKPSSLQRVTATETLEGIPEGSADLSNLLTFEVRSGWLNYPNIPVEQRQTIATDIAQIVGNGKLQRVIADSNKSKGKVNRGNTTSPETKAKIQSTSQNLVQRDDEVGLRLSTGQIISDWSTAVTEIAALYTGVSKGIGWYKHKGVDQWYRQSQHDDPTPVWHTILIDAVGFAAAATVAGYGAVLTAQIVKSASSSLVRASIAAAIDTGKNVAKSVASAGVSTALKNGGSDGRDVYLDGLKYAIDNSNEEESNRLAGELNNIAGISSSSKWSELQLLYNTLKQTRSQAQEIAYGSAVEGWMSASSQNNTGFDFQIGSMTLMGMYRRGNLTLRQMQTIKSCLTVNIGLNHLPSECQQVLRAALGTNWNAEPIERVTDAGTLATMGDITLSPTSTVGTIELHLTIPNNGGNPSVEYCEIESNTGINDSTRAYFMNSPKKVEEFAVPKLLLADDLAIGFDERNSSEIRGGSEWLAQYGARQMKQWNPGKPWNFSDAEISVFRTSAIAFLRHNILGRTLQGLGVTSIED